MPDSQIQNIMMRGLILISVLIFCLLNSVQSQWGNGGGWNNGYGNYGPGGGYGGGYGGNGWRGGYGGTHVKKSSRKYVLFQEDSVPNRLTMSRMLLELGRR